MRRRWKSRGNRDSVGFRFESCSATRRRNEGDDAGLRVPIVGDRRERERERERGGRCTWFGPKLGRGRCLRAGRETGPREGSWGGLGRGGQARGLAGVFSFFYFVSKAFFKIEEEFKTKIKQNHTAQKKL